MIKLPYKLSQLDLQLLLSFPVFRPQVWGFLLVTELFESQRRLIKTRALDHAAVSLAMSCVRHAGACRAQGTRPTQAAGHGVRVVCPKRLTLLKQNVQA